MSLMLSSSSRAESEISLSNCAVRKLSQRGGFPRNAQTAEIHGRWRRSRFGLRNQPRDTWQRAEPERACGIAPRNVDEIAGQPIRYREMFNASALDFQPVQTAPRAELNSPLIVFGHASHLVAR